MNSLGNQINKPRFAGLDLSRGVCALVVFLGHFLIQDQHFNFRPHNILFTFLELRHFCVLYFFLLSGYVLRISSRKHGVDLRWLYARLSRLYPLYFICWFIPYLGLRLLGSSEIQINGLGTFLGIFGLQSWTVKHSLDGPNSPLWSLSVEIALALIFFFISRFSSILVFISLIICMQALSMSFEVIPVMSAIPYFVTGILIAELEGRFMHIQKFTKFLLVIFLFNFIVVAPFYFEGMLSSPRNLLSLIAATLMLICFRLMRIPQSLMKFSTYLGTRSFSLYASHAPLLWIYKRLIFGPVKNQLIEPAGPLYFFGGLLLALSVAELLYQTIDKRALAISRKLLARSRNMQIS